MSETFDPNQEPAMEGQPEVDVAYPREAFNPPPQPWTWVLFGFVICFLAGMSLVSYFSPPKKDSKPDESVAMEVKTSLKLTLVTTTLSALSNAPKTGQEGQAFAQAESQIDKKVLSEEEARYLAVIQAAQGKEVDEKALGILEKSKDPLDQATLQAVNGDPKAADKLNVRSRDYAERLAWALSKEAGGDEKARGQLIPVPIAGLTVGVMMGGLLAIGMGVIILVGYFVYKGTGGLPPAVGFPVKNLSLFQADISALKFCIWIIGYFFVGQLIVALLLAKMNLPMMVEMLAGSLVGFGILVAVDRMTIVEKLDSIWVMVRGKGPIWKLAGIGVLGYLANIPLMLASVLITSRIMANFPTPSHPLSDEMAKGQALGGVFVAWLVAGVLAPIMEEVVFRGWLFQGLLKRTSNVLVSILITGFSFAIIHPQGPILWVALASVGMMNAFLTYRTWSLIPAIVMHAVHNSSIVLMQTLVLS